MWKSIVAAALLAQYADAQRMLRFACNQLVVERTDPIVQPGQIYTGHLHQIVGGNSFNITMDPEGHDLPGQSDCTSCSFAEDFSNYWTAVMFYRNNQGRYFRVPSVGNGGPQGKLYHADGGMDIYYMGNGAKMTAFQKGFRMIHGDAGNRDPAAAKPGLCHRCWNGVDESRFTGGAPCTGRDTVEIPQSRDCGMIRQTLIFPHCWDGKNLDSANHQDHVSFGARYPGASGGAACSGTHPVRIPQIMYEVMWNTSEFTRRDDWPTNGEDPFVLSMGIGGAAVHGDYVFGWKDDSLQRAMDSRTCNLDRTCDAITKQPNDQYTSCKVPQSAPEDTGDGEGGLESLNTGGVISK